jgi:hypothetical protein
VGDAFALACKRYTQLADDVSCRTAARLTGPRWQPPHDGAAAAGRVQAVADTARVRRTRRADGGGPGISREEQVSVAITL